MTALPRPTALNINTLDPTLAPLIHPRLSALQLERSRNAGPFNSVQDVLQSDLTAGLPVDGSLITVTSSYFQATIVARFGDWHQPLISRLFMDPVSGDIELIDRQLVVPDLAARGEALLDKEAADDSPLAL